MSIVLILIAKLLPLYLLIYIGYMAGKKLHVTSDSIASLIVYVFVPIVVFEGVITSPLSKAIVALPLFFFALNCILSLLFLYISSLVWKGPEKNIQALLSGMSGTGYFGLPIVLALFGDKYLGIASVILLGNTLYSNSLGFYLIARGTHTGREAFKKLLGVPTLYLFIIGLILSFYHVTLPGSIMDVIRNVRGGYIVIGMMIMGIGLSQITKTSFDFKFVGVAFLSKFIAWPVITGILVFIDMNYVHLFTFDMYKILLVMSTVPIASNAVAYATKFDIFPEKTSLTVLLSTFFALIYVPIFIAFVLPIFG